MLYFFLGFLWASHLCCFGDGSWLQLQHKGSLGSATPVPFCEQGVGELGLRTRWALNSELPSSLRASTQCTQYTVNPVGMGAAPQPDTLTLVRSTGNPTLKGT